MAKKSNKRIYAPGIFVFIKDTTLDECKETGGNVYDSGKRRPYCVVAKDPKHKEILWVVPVTSQIVPYKKKALIEHRSWRPDKYQFYNLLGKENCFNPSRMIPVLQSDVDELYKKRGFPVQMKRKNFLELRRLVLSVVQSPELSKIYTKGVDEEKLYQRSEKTLEQEQKKEHRKEKLQEWKSEREQEEKRERDKELDQKLELEQKKEQGQKQKQEKKEQQAGIAPSNARTPQEAPKLKNAVELSAEEAKTLLMTSTAQIEKKPLDDFNSRRSAEFEELEKRHQASRIDYRSVADNLPKKSRFEIWGFKKRLQEWQKRRDEACKQYEKDRDVAEKHKVSTAEGRKEIHKKATEAAKLAHPEAVAAIKQDEERKKAVQQHQIEEQKQQRKEQRQQREEQRQQSKSRRKQLGR